MAKARGKGRMVGEREKARWLGRPKGMSGRQWKKFYKAVQRSLRTRKEVAP